MNDDEWQASKLWGSAITRWQEGEAEPLRALLLAHDPLPDFAREFLADLVAGKAKRRRGAPPKYTGIQERALFTEAMQRWDELEGADKTSGNTGPRDAAISYVADRHDMKHDALRGILNRLHAVGMTRDMWLRIRNLSDARARLLPGL